MRQRDCRILAAGAGWLALMALAACTERAPIEPSNAGGDTPAPAAEIADGYEGIASDGTRYPITRTGGTEGFVASSAGTGEIGGGKALAGRDLSGISAITSGLGIETIIPPDDRRKVEDTTSFPARANVLVVSERGRCSGAMISPNTVITAGHCVHNAGSWARSVQVYPGRNGGSSPYGGCSGAKLYSVLGWTRDRNEAYDIGAIKLNCNVGNRTGWLGFFWQSASLAGKQATISSYPGDKPLEQWAHTDSVRADSGLQVFYRTDTFAGNSGSAVFASVGVPAGCGGPCIYGVHAYGLHGRTPHANNNHGTRITQPLFNNLIRWRSE